MCTLLHSIKAFFINIIQGDLLKLFEPDFDPEGLGIYIVTLRKEKGLSLRKLEELGSNQFSYTYVFKLEHGQIANPNPDMLITILATLGLTPKEIKHTLKKYGIKR